MSSTAQQDKAARCLRGASIGDVPSSPKKRLSYRFFSPVRNPTKRSDPSSPSSSSSSSSSSLLPFEKIQVIRTSPAKWRYSVPFDCWEVNEMDLGRIGHGSSTNEMHETRPIFMVYPNAVGGFWRVTSTSQWQLGTCSAYSLTAKSHQEFLKHWLRLKLCLAALIKVIRNIWTKGCLPPSAGLFAKSTHSRPFKLLVSLVSG